MPVRSWKHPAVGALIVAGALFTFIAGNILAGDPLAVLDARIASESAERSIAGQVEFWARLGRAIEPLLQGAQVLALCRSGAARPLSECIESVDTPVGRRRVAEYLAMEPFPHFEPADGKPAFLMRIDADGGRTLGRFVSRRFEAVKSKSKTRR